MPGLLDQFDMRDHLAQPQQPQQPQMDPNVLQRMQQQAMFYSQRLGIPYEQAMQQAMQRLQTARGMMSGRAPSPGGPAAPTMPGLSGFRG